jgi:hypothetical protein
VPRSVTNVELMISLPMWVAFRPVSTSTAYTTASDVVASAIPPICAAFQSQPNPYRQANITPMNGTRNDNPPISTLGLRVARMCAGSTSAPARKGQHHAAEGSRGAQLWHNCQEPSALAGGSDTRPGGIHRRAPVKP